MIFLHPTQLRKTSEDLYGRHAWKNTIYFTLAYYLRWLLRPIRPRRKANPRRFSNDWYVQHSYVELSTRSFDQSANNINGLWHAPLHKNNKRFERQGKVRLNCVPFTILFRNFASCFGPHPQIMCKHLPVVSLATLLEHNCFSSVMMIHSQISTWVVHGWDYIGDGIMKYRIGNTNIR